jgi:serine/threonine protein kinase
MSIHLFHPDFLQHYKISSFFANEVRGGQKNVHFAIIEGEKIVFKLFPGGKDQRFEREMEIYEKFNHLEGIPKVVKIDTYNKDTIVFEKFIEGNPLSEILGNYTRDNGRINGLMKNLFLILKPIWEARFVHRDIKPGNIMITPDGKPVVIDFGIARDLDGSSLTGTGWQPKSWRFASPEQYAGQKDMISYRTDFFSLAVLGYFLFHAKLPFGETEIEIDQKFQSRSEGFVADTDFGLSPFCMEAMRFSPVDRPRDIDELLKLIP